LAASIRSRLLLLAGLGAAAPVAAQVPAQVLGRVVRLVGSDTMAVGGAEIVLHQIGTAAQGPLDSMRVDAGGRFRFRFVADSGTLYLLSVKHHGISYFSSPVAREPSSRIDDILLVVSDTSANAPVEVAARSVIVSGVEPSGARTIVEVIEIANRGQRTRVAPDSQPTLVIPLLRGSTGAAVQDTDLSPQAVRIVRDTLTVSAPIAPGARMVIIQSTLPAGVRRLELPAGAAADTLQVLLARGNLSLQSALPSVGEQIIDERPYRRWSGAWPGDRPLVIAVTGVALSQRTTLIGLVIGLVLAMAGGLVWIGRRRQPAPTPAIIVPARSAASLVEELARLDARFEGRQSATEPAEWQRYLTERARLKGELEQALARSPRSS